MEFRQRVESWVESNLALWNGEEYFLNDRRYGENYTVEEFLDECLDCFEEIVDKRGVSLEQGATVVEELENRLPERYRGILENSRARSVQAERLKQHYRIR